jgi:hypothetical protein
LLRENQNPLLFSNFQLAQRCGNVCPGTSGFHFFINVRDLALRIDVKSPTLGNGAAFMNDTVGFGNFLAGITQNRVIKV